MICSCCGLEVESDGQAYGTGYVHTACLLGFEIVVGVGVLDRIDAYRVDLGEFGTIGEPHINEIPRVCHNGE